MNLLIKEYQEIFNYPQTKINGKWNVSIVSSRGEDFPFGIEMKKNLILNQGLDILAAGRFYAPYSVYNWNTIPSFLMGGAYYGDSDVAPNISDTSLTNQTSETREINDDSCNITDNLVNGTRTFRKVYDFPVIEEFPTSTQPTLLREIGVYTDWNDKKLFAKFVLPKTIKLSYGQFVRLYYDFTIGSDSIINPANINRSSGSFDATGQLKLCGRFDDIFGSFDSNGNPVIAYGDSSRASFVPYYDRFCAEVETCETEIFGTAYLMTPEILNFTSLNVPIISEWAGERLEENLNTINPSNYVNGNFYRDIEYIFDYLNPAYDERVQGFLFTVLRGSSFSPRQNIIDGWLWKFNNIQVKQSSKKIVMMIRQSVNRI